MFKGRLCSCVQPALWETCFTVETILIQTCAERLALTALDSAAISDVPCG